MSGRTIIVIRGRRAHRRPKAATAPNVVKAEAKAGASKGLAAPINTVSGRRAKGGAPRSREGQKKTRGSVDRAPTPTNLTPAQAMALWKKEGVIGPFRGQTDSIELARELRRQAETRDHSS